MPTRRQRGRTLTPRLRARIAELRVKVPWLGLRKIAEALGLSLHQVRQALVEPPPGNRLRTPRRCPTCGRLLKIWPCLPCRAEARQTPPQAP